MTSSSKSRQIKLGALLPGGGQRVAAWRIEIELSLPRERGEGRFVRYREDLLREFGQH
jgi:hypothetical protein